MVTDHLLAEGRDDDVAVVDGAREHTYADLRLATRRIVAALLDSGVRPGERVALLGVNSFFWVAAYLAAMKLGVVVPLSDKATDEELAAQLRFVGCGTALVDRRSRRRFAGALGGLKVLDETSLDRDGEEAWPDGEVAGSADAALMFTSGTTARPKAVRLTHRNLLANTESIVEYLGLGRADRMLVILPFHYVFGASLLHTHLAVGGTLVLCNTFTFPETAVELIERHGCTGFAGVPSSYQLLLKASSFASRPLPTLGHLQQAGGRLAPDLIRALVAAQPQARVFVMYGQTEATARLSFLPPGLLDTKLGSIGQGIPGVELVVCDANGNRVSVGEQGEIRAFGENISPGYLDDPEATDEKFVDGWLRTGDLAVVDDEGFVYVVGRSGDFIKSWGFRIAPQQVEEAALRHPLVAAATAVGLPDPDAGEAVGLAVAAIPGAELDETELLAFLRDLLPKHAVPARLAVWDQVPTTASGKTNRARVRALLEEESEA